MTKTAMIRARTTPAVKADTERIFQRLGISTSEAINLFLAQVKMQGLAIRCKDSQQSHPEGNEGCGRREKPDHI